MDKAATPPTFAEARCKRHHGGHKSARPALQRRCVKPLTGGAPPPQVRWSARALGYGDSSGAGVYLFYRERQPVVRPVGNGALNVRFSNTGKPSFFGHGSRKTFRPRVPKVFGGGVGSFARSLPQGLAIFRKPASARIEPICPLGTRLAA
jgi:hypothetical protein